MGIARPVVQRRLTRPGTALALVILVLLILRVFGASLLEVYRLDREAARLEAVKRDLQGRNALLREEIKLLHTPQYIERLAREQLGLVKPGEVAILIVREKPYSPAPAPPQPDRRRLWERVWRVLIGWFEAIVR